MTQNDIARMARESGGLPDPMVFIGAYERFANLVVAAKWERTSASFNDWWDSDSMPPSNPFAEGSPAYWAWAGWQAAQRKWAGLTDDQLDEIAVIARRGNLHDLRIVIEAKLKERNND